MVTVPSWGRYELIFLIMIWKFVVGFCRGICVHFLGSASFFFFLFFSSFCVNYCRAFLGT
ncbi:hypothetical protein QBC38DRAFT_473947 [Podospora fimiseda]|uniref:Uncharacterized protein n=1 Tax=Podospora fimiseda TaxID=252190 RepID=A0AAN7BT48_9PEZI|nr:hypothetical protein QBC38DRAFT_473947 [Podospora fimiseda]